MVFFGAALGLLLNILFWGLGLSWLCTPRRWRLAWPVFTGLAGVGLQSAVVWFGVQMDWSGTESYGRWALLVPVGLLLLAWKLRGSSDWRPWLRLSGLFVSMLVVLNCITIPFASASKWLTSSSLGSCDAADYAAGARVLQDFARTDRDGFIGLTEVVRVQSVDNFFDYWLYLNHFTPSALIALNGAIAGLQPYQLVSITGAVLLVLGMPLAFWLARSALRLGPGGALLVALVYGLSPLLWYAVAHASLSQLVAAPAIAAVTWCGVALWRSGSGLRAAVRVSGVLVLAYWSILGGYNFIILVCLVPAAGYVLGQAVWSGRYVRLLGWFVGMLLPLGGVALAAPARVTGLMDRFRLFQQYDFGWKIPALSPEGWYGLVGTVTLAGYGDALRWTLSAVLMAGLLLSLVLAARRRQTTVFLVVCLTVPILIGYVVLLLKGRAHGTNASYDAYKLFAVFYPGILAALGYSLVHLRSRRAGVRMAVACAAGLVLAGNAIASYRFAVRLENPPLLVDRGLARLQTIESMPEVKSVNLLVVDFWSRLWANSFLLHKPHYFPSHTYEGRLNTALKGEWDLLGGLIAVSLPDRDRHIAIDKHFTLVDTRSPYFVRARVGEGWYDGERLPRANLRWRWTKGNAELLIENPHSRSLDVGFRFQARSMEPRTLEIWIQGKRRRTVRLGTELSWVRVPSVVLPPGLTAVEIRSPTPPLPAGPTDSRLLGFAAFGIEVNVRSDPDPSDQ
jgi:hypothetical protein